MRCAGEKKENALLVGLKKRQGSEIEKFSIKSLITLADFESAAALLEERSRSGFNQQLKSPPKMSKWEDMSRRAEKSFLKNSVSSQFGAYTLTKMSWVPYKLPVTFKYLPLGSESTLEQTKGIDL